ncbi:MAG TPA: metalloregulator ArsR/SmtB family transcription factor [Gemmatimonadaceae bacterium]|nr:metalloregulator ArsR/SmtB family transcription factor [Gemmatimonadaceae bacterium]
MPDVFRAIADPTRRSMLDLLRESDRSVAELSRPFRMSQPAIHQHLRVLRDAGLVRALWRGGRRLYRINRKPLEAIYGWVAPYRELDDPSGHRWAVVEAAPPVKARGDRRTKRRTAGTAH